MVPVASHSASRGAGFGSLRASSPTDQELLPKRLLWTTLEGDRTGRSSAGASPWCLPLVPSPSNCFVPLPELHAGSSRRFLGRPLPSPRGIPAAFLPAGLCSPLSSDPQEEKRRWAQKPSPLREGGQQPRVSVPSPRLIHLLFQILCLPLLWVNPYLATPGVRKAGEGITAVRSPPALACPTRFWGKNQEGWSRLCLLIERRALPSQAASKESPAAGFPHTALTFTATCNLAVFLEGPDASKVLPSISTDIVKMGA